MGEPPKALMTGLPRHFGLIGRLLSRWVGGVVSHATWIVLAFTVATVLLATQVVTRLGVNTDTADMISEHLPWRQTYIRYKEEFPQYKNQLLVEVEGKTPDLADRARRELADRLRSEPELFPSVYVPGGGSFFDGQALLYLSPDDLTELADNLEKFGPWVRRLEADPSLAGFLVTLEAMMTRVRRGEEDLELAPFLGAMVPAFTAPLEWRFYQLSWQELLWGHPAGPGERRAFILVQPRLDFEELLPARRAMSRVRELVEELSLTPERGIRVRLTGKVAMEHEELRSVMSGAKTVGLLALLMVMAILYMGLRSVRLVLAAAVTLVVGLVWTAAFAAVAIGHLNLISVAFAVLYIGLGIDYAIHLCLRYRELGGAGLSHPDALRGAAGDVGSSLAVSAVTTAACFYAFVPTAFTGVSELGLISGTGMFISFFVTLTFLPALLTLGRPRSGIGSAPATGSGSAPATGGQFLLLPDLGRAVEWLTAWLSEIPRRRPRTVLSGALVVGLGCLVLLPRLRFDHNPLNLRDPATESVSAYRELLADSTAVPLTMAILELDAAAAERTAERVADLEVVAKAITLTDFVPERQEEKRAIIRRIAAELGPSPATLERDAASANAGTLRDSEPVLAAVEDFLGTLARFRAFVDSDASDVARYLGFQIRPWLARVRSDPPETRARRVAELEASLTGALPGQLRTLRIALDPSPVTLDDLPAELTKRWVSPGGLHRVEVHPAENVASTPPLRRFVESVQSVAPQATEAPVLELEAGDAVVRAFRSALLWAVLATVLLLLVVLRRLRDTLLVLIPLLLAGLLTAGAAVLLGQSLNFANVIALPLLLGVGVDNGIHMVHRVRAAPPEHGNLLRTSTARAVVFASLTTVFSFGNLALSAHPGTASMGRFLTMGMLAVLLCSLVLLPTLLQLGTPAGRTGGFRPPARRARVPS